MRQRLADISTRLVRLAFGATIILLPFHLRATLMARPQPPIYRDYTDLFLFASDVFLVATLILWLASFALEPRRVRFGPLFLTLPIAGVTVFGIISTIGSVDATLSFYHSIRLLLLDGLYLFTINETRTLEEIAVPAALQVFIQSVVGIAQYLQQHSVGLQWLGELALDPRSKGISTVWSGTDISLRAYGLTDHPNILGGCLACALLLLVVSSARIESRWRAPATVLLAAGTLTLFLTFSRAAWLAAASGIVLVLGFLFLTRRTRGVLDVLALGVAVSILLLPFIWRNLGYLDARLNPNEVSMFTGGNRALVERDVLNSATLEIFRAHPITGIGLGATPIAMRAAFPNLPFDYQPAHIVLLDVAAETGILGALAFLVLMFAPWIALWRHRKRLAWSPALIGITAALLAVTLIGFFDYYTWLLEPGRLWQWSIWGAWGAIYRLDLR
ncbi:MAG: O-antigen ligase family protein [Chloroflexota bacterium]|nr:O-antigen ligase family protein [Chloroflexota bacterium]